MPNMQPKKTPISEQNSEKRRKNFDEVVLGYTADEAICEAERCLNCKHRPCVSACPVGVPIPEFIVKISESDFEGAAKTIKEANSLPAVCGRVCPQEKQCESKCVRAIKGESVAIGRLERFAADFELQQSIQPQKIEIAGKKVAIVGGGPAGLTCAGELVKKSYDVTIFEAFHTAGGVLMYGIPEFRLPKSIVRQEIEALKNLGVKIETNVVIGKTLTLDYLKNEGFEAIFLGTGAGLPSFMGIEGESAIGVFSANEFLTRINLFKAYKSDYDMPIIDAENVAVIGGGNVAMDAARSAVRLGAKTVSIIYRRGEEEMPARLEEIHHAKEEGVELKLLTNPIRILADENHRVNGIECVKMELGEPDNSGRRSPTAISNSEFILPVDTVIIAIGNTPNPLVSSSNTELETNRRGCLVVNENTLQTSMEAVYAGGDAVTGAATVILAMGAGKEAANSIDEYLKQKEA